MLKRLSARVIHEDLIATLGADAVGHGLVMRYPRETRYSASTVAPSSVDIRMVMDDADQTILAAFDEIPFAPIGRLS
jgi:hypothetical protein